MMFGINKPIRETVKRIPKNSIGVELGVWKGNSSLLLASRSKKLHLVDAWSVEPYGDNEYYYDRYSSMTGGSSREHFMDYYDRIYEGVVKRFKGNPKIIIHRCSTNDFFKTLNEPIDWFYVDASHEKEGVYMDLCNCWDHLKKNNGGIIFGDDYGDKKGVVLGVKKFLEDHPTAKFSNFFKNQFEIKIT